MPQSRQVKEAYKTDFAAVDAMTDSEIEQNALADDESSPLTEEDWAKGFVGMPPLKSPITANFDTDVIAWFKSQGRGYQTRMNAVLRRYMEAHRKVG